MRQLTFKDKGKNVVTAEIPGELQDDAELARHVMLEELSKYNDEVMELMLEENPVPTALIHQVIREATLQRAIQPVLCGSALDHIGVQPVLDAVAQYLPSPADMPPVEGEAPGRKAKDKAHQEQR